MSPREIEHCQNMRSEGLDLGTSPRSALIRSQRTGQVCVDSSDRMTKWEWKLRNYSVKLNLAPPGGGQCGGIKKRETIDDAIVDAIDWSCLRNRTIVRCQTS